MKAIFKRISTVLLAVLLIALSVTSVFAHSGRTDSSGGHKDNKNKSGLGYYHYHCGGYPAHLHPNGVCPYKGTPQSTTGNTSGTTSGNTSTGSGQTVITPNYNYDGLFWDVFPSDWFSDEVEVAYNLGLVKGESATFFNPNGNIRISEAITLAARLHSMHYANGMVFVQGTPWYQVYIDYAVANGIIYSGQFYDYSQYATRAEFATIFSAALPDEALPEINTIASIPDVYGYESYADEVFKLYRAGILTGSDSKGTFAPYSTIRRCEVATIVSRMALPEMREEFSLTTASNSAYQAGSLSASVTSINLDVGKSTTLSITANGDNITIVGDYNASYIDIDWGEWNGNTIPLTVYALSEGYSSLKIYIEEDPSICLYIDVLTN